MQRESSTGSGTGTGTGMDKKTGTMVRFDGVHCGIGIARPAPGVILLILRGNDVGELGEAPFRELEPDLAAGRSIQLFVDARHVTGASLGVSGEWALWLRRHRDQLQQVTMLPGSRFIQITAEFVRRFAELPDLMQITTDPKSFDEALAAATRREHRE